MRGFIPLVGAALLLGATDALAVNQVAVKQDAGHGRVRDVYQQHIRRNYRDTSRFIGLGRAIALEGTPEQVVRLTDWLDTIATVPYGRETLQAIFSSGNQLVIRHSPWALLASGRTLASVTSKLINGRGDDVLILFDVRIPEHGSHQVFDAAGEPLEFTALQNLFHELAHARHQTNGTWRYWDSEGQAIEAENRFRAEYAGVQGEQAVTLRSGMEGRQLWWPASGITRTDW